MMGGFVSALVLIVPASLNHSHSHELDAAVRPPKSLTESTRSQAMKQEDLKTMADRCRLLADSADDFTRKRLLELALKYEARLEGRSLASKRLISMTIDNQNNAGRQSGNGSPG